MLKSKLSLLILSLFLFGCTSATKSMGTPISKSRAIQIAESEFVKIFGKDVLEQRPFTANLKGEIWEVEGTLRCGSTDPDVVCFGGVAGAEIRATDGKVLKVEHGE